MSGPRRTISDSSLAIRPPEHGEAAELAHLHNTSWEEAYSALLPPRFWDRHALSKRLNLWSRILANPDHVAATRIATWRGTPVGFGMVGTPQDPDISVKTELLMMYVLEDHHGTGVAERLLTELLGESPAVLWVFKDNPRAQAFYRKHGFRPDGGEKDLGVKENDAGLQGIAEVRMVRGVSPAAAKKGVHA